MLSRRKFMTVFLAAPAALVGAVGLGKLLKKKGPIKFKAISDVHYGNHIDAALLDDDIITVSSEQLQQAVYWSKIEPWNKGINCRFSKDEFAEMMRLIRNKPRAHGMIYNIGE